MELTLLIKYIIWLKNCCKINLTYRQYNNIRRRAENRQAADKWTKFDLENL